MRFKSLRTLCREPLDLGLADSFSLARYLENRAITSSKTMAKEQVTRLFREAKRNPTLRETLNKAPNPERFVEMANQRGYVFTVKEWQDMTKFSVEELKCDLSEIPGL